IIDGMEEICNTTAEAPGPRKEHLDMHTDSAGGCQTTTDLPSIEISTQNQDTARSTGTNINEDKVDTPSSKRIKLDSNLSEDLKSNEACLVSSDETPTTLDELNKKKKCIKQKKELLEQLELVKLYQNKWSIQELTDLTTSWKDVATSAFEDLHQLCSVGETLTKKGLIKHLGIDGSLIDIDSDPDSE
ncbi:Swi5-dependent recombination DNA repair protein 1, partial [Orchesella cincta]